MDEKGKKDDAEKPDCSLLPSVPLLGAARVLGMGKRKYGAHNWRGGIEYSRLYAATLRHLLAFNDGENIDDESGLPHLDHALCELMFLREMYETRKDLDDRYKPKEKFGGNKRALMVFEPSNAAKDYLAGLGSPGT